MFDSLLLAFVVSAVPPTDDVAYLPDVIPPQGGETVEIVVAKDEYEPGSFVVRSDLDVESVELRVGELKTADGKVFPAKDVDLRAVKVWYQNGNAWFSYFGDTGMKLVPELLLHDERLVRVDTAKKANYARIVAQDGSVSERWINPPRQFDSSHLGPQENTSVFRSMAPGFADAKTMQPVSFRKGETKQFYLTVHATKETPAGLYRGEIGISSGTSGTVRLVAIPVTVRVLDFELPAPRCYLKPERPFRVSSYSGCSLESLMSYNGFDLELAKRQLEAVIRNEAEHNQTYHMGCGLYPGDELLTAWELAKKHGMRTDSLFTGELKENCEWGMKIGWERDPSAVADQLRTCAVHRAQLFDRRFGTHDVWITYGDEPGSAWVRKNRPLFEIYQREGFKFMIAGSDIVYNLTGYAFDWFNAASAPEDARLATLWSRTGEADVAWYANQHVGAENPSLSRRQNGLAAWLSGYTALCNYTEDLGPWNDDTTTYRPMVYAYGTYDGVVDTLAWEAFREGIDDIRYGTLLCRLAREAQRRGDWKARSESGKALQYLARFNVAKDSVSSARQEMIAYIGRLRAVLAEQPVFGSGIALPDGFEAEVAEAERTKNYARLRRAYVEYDRCEEGERRFKEMGRWDDALAIWRNRWFRGAYYADLKPQEVARVYREGLASKKASEGFKKEAFLYLYGEDPVRDRELEPLFWGKTQSSTNNALWRLGKVIGEGGPLQQGRPRVGAELAIKYLETLNRLRLPIDNPGRVEFAIHQLPQAGLPDECVRLCELTLASSNRFTAAKLFGFRLLAETLRVRRTLGTAESASRLLSELDAKYRAKLPPKDRAEMISWVGCAFNALGQEEAMRGFDAYRRALYASYDRRRCRVGGKPVRQTLDRRYKGSLEFLETDVTTGDRGKVGTGGEALPDPTMEVSASVAGLRFVFTVPDPKAREVELGVTDPGAFEAYLAPGKDKPYVCFLMTPGKNRVSAFNSSYDTADCRAFDSSDVDSYRFTTEYRDDAFVCTLELSWSLYAGVLPKTGDVWDFEVVRWGRSGNACWNGLESIHGRSTWGELEFAIEPATARAIRLRQAYAAFNAYDREKTYGRVNGCLGRWADDATGDPAFYEQCLKPLVDELDGYGKQLAFDMSDAALDEICAKALPKWHAIRRLVDDAREAYLRKQRTTKDN